MFTPDQLVDVRLSGSEVARGRVLEVFDQANGIRVVVHHHWHENSRPCRREYCCFASELTPVPECDW